MALVCVEDFEEKASSQLEKSTLDYYKSGAGEQFSLKLNREAFRRLRLRPRCLRDVSQPDISCQILGQQQKWPVGIAPTAMQKMAHPDGEIGNARAAGKAGSIFILSTLSTTSLEDLAAGAPDTHKWFQLYIYKDRSLTKKLVHRAEKANFKALVLTIDAPIFGHRRSDVRNKFSLPSHLSLANFQGEQANGVVTMGGSGINEYVVNQFDPSITWKDINWLKQLTSLPIIVKGVLTAEDAVLAREFGCAGIIVSNHGARQIDTVPASIEALPEVVKAVGKDLLVMLDGGIMQGNDIFKALALGAKTVFIGRPAVYGLAYNGERGVEELLSVLRKDFEITMALIGCQKLKDIQSNMVVHESFYSKI
ncbi:peroxisomal (S)-2-hydroxy-acid oxidase GLO5 [Drosophila grimshawi]|uniref:(S)-2-hydroxy-acid oxidase n=1 Tax=Drosophila grimshawi TaxID=7222 RepID=B4J7J3_DROGR|nr:peroxisomal (S)-2-hydroxy-acid oxidase GLO5 [Drosophila grimshawi]EDW02141.1 GH20058 [Drosophila grimshawi]